MFCSNCGTQVEDGVKFCPNCGNSFQTAPAPEIAPMPQVAAPAPEIAPMPQVAAPAPEIAPMPQVAAPAPEIAPMSQVAAPMPSIAPPPQTGIPVPPQMNIPTPPGVIPPVPAAPQKAGGKKMDGKMIGIIAGAVVAVIALVALVIYLLSDKDTEPEEAAASVAEVSSQQVEQSVEPVKQKYDVEMQLYAVRDIMYLSEATGSMRVFARNANEGETLVHEQELTGGAIPVLSLEDGWYMFEFQVDGYSTSHIEVEVNGANIAKDVNLFPQLQSENGVMFLLTWNDADRDLDLHMRDASADENAPSIYGGKSKAYEDNWDYGLRESTSGCETIELPNRDIQCQIWVNDYTNAMTGDLFHEFPQATLYVLTADGLQYIAEAPGGAVGSEWRVCDYDNGMVYDNPSVYQELFAWSTKDKNLRALSARREHMVAGNYTTEYDVLYDVYGQEIARTSETFQDEQSISWERAETDYDENGNILEERFYDRNEYGEGMLYERRTYRYNSWGDMEYEASYNRDGSMTSECNYNYTYNDMGQKLTADYMTLYYENEEYAGSGISNYNEYTYDDQGRMNAIYYRNQQFVEYHFYSMDDDYVYGTLAYMPEDYSGYICFYDENGNVTEVWSMDYSSREWYTSEEYYYDDRGNLEISMYFDYDDTFDDVGEGWNYDEQGRLTFHHYHMQGSMLALDGDYTEMYYYDDMGRLYTVHKRYDDGSDQQTETTYYYDDTVNPLHMHTEVKGDGYMSAEDKEKLYSSVLDGSLTQEEYEKMVEATLVSCTDVYFEYYD